MSQIPEPPFDDEDTNPSLSVRPVEFDDDSPDWRQAVAVLSLLGALVFTIATAIVLFLPGAGSQSPENVEAPTDAQIQDASVAPTTVTNLEPSSVDTATGDSLPPLVNAEQFAGNLQSPLADTALNVSYLYNPFTVINSDRARSEIVQYTVVQGDTIDAIAGRYGLQRETLAWCNDRRIIQVLRPGDVLTIPPVDGACHQVLGTREETIAGIAEQYQLDDPYAIIDSPYNSGQLPGNVSPNDILLGGTNLFIPNGQGPIITWNPGRNVETDASGVVVGVTFAPGQSGSCGRVNPGGGSVWTNPLPSGTWVRGFYAGHSGIDLAAPTGTPIYAANSGYVLFSGFSRWGYGEAVVLEHGPILSTLYGHMSSRAVSCGQFVSAGQVIGYVGSTGNSSGPHLHFEIRFNDTPTDPTTTLGIGW